MLRYLSIKPKGLSAESGFEASTVETEEVTLRETPPQGISYVRTIQAGICGTDSGYYSGGRFHNEWNNRDKIQTSTKHMHERGLLSAEKTREDLLLIPCHEGWGEVVKSTRHRFERPRKIAALRLRVKANRIAGVMYDVVTLDFQNLKRGDKVVVNATLRCDEHWKIGKTGFPEPCSRATENGHVSKQVPGHLEMPGMAFSSSAGLPFPNLMLTKVPDLLNEWIEVHPSKRSQLLVLTEPLACCFEALRPCVPIPAMTPPQKAEDGNEQEEPDSFPAPHHSLTHVAILGDGPNAMLMALTCLTFFPGSTVYVTGKTMEKLRVIARLDTRRVHCIKLESKHTAAETRTKLKEALKGHKLDVVIPTVEGPTQIIREYKDIMTPNALIVVWAATQVEQCKKIQETTDYKIHLPYGGWCQAEWSALHFWETVAVHQPDLLETVCEYPFTRMTLDEVADALAHSFHTTRTCSVKVPMDEDQHCTTAKIIIDCIAPSNTSS